MDFGDQRVYASHSSIMFSRRACYFFVRPKKKMLELCFFLGRTVKSPLVRRAMAASRTKVAHIVHITIAIRSKRRSPTGSERPTT